ncbi:phosphatase PAP2 family protein [Actinoplanes sp. KI2]|uniref:phosphatase PAP2 family protein n=1 Tax=Actinoplanes sp. KI2 TaxID=2983315 RepID=UPI0021D58911|nr:phosphatase PAP2 family protein [Actinoplanes sp. KI2]MCU7727570.1 phosphatase PAP2 family protein [Actinoplanes sp. KI2]
MRGKPAARRALRELLLVAVLFLAYKLGRVLVEGHVGAALTNARDVWDFERLVHLPSEESLQAALLGHLWWIRAANSFYAYVHFPATAAALVWLYRRRPGIYLWFRRSLASLTAFALLIHSLFPLAPPRMLTSAGMVDTGHLYGPSVYGAPSTDTLSNQYAAMPSLHVGWALTVAIAMIAATRSRWRWLWAAHPVVTLLVVVVTGNHYWLDAIAAVTLVALVLAVVTPLSRPPAVAPAPRPATAVVPAPRPAIAVAAAPRPALVHEIPALPPFPGLGVYRPVLPEQRRDEPAPTAYSTKTHPEGVGRAAEVPRSFGL